MKSLNLDNVSILQQDHYKATNERFFQTNETSSEDQVLENYNGNNKVSSNTVIRKREPTPTGSP